MAWLIHSIEKKKLRLYGHARRLLNLAKLIPHASLHPPARSLSPSRGTPLSAADHFSSSWVPSVLLLVPGLSPSSSLGPGTRGAPPILARTTSLSAVGASMAPSSLAVNNLGRIFQRSGMRAMMRTGKPDLISQRSGKHVVVDLGLLSGHTDSCDCL